MRKVFILWIVISTIAITGLLIFFGQNGLWLCIVVILFNLWGIYDCSKPNIPLPGSLLNLNTIPEKWKQEWCMAEAESFVPKFTPVYIEED